MVVNKIAIDMQNIAMPQVIHMVQDDSQWRLIEVTMTNNGQPWIPDQGSHAIIWYSKPDGTSGTYDVDELDQNAVTIDGNIATCRIVAQATTVPGDVLMQVSFFDANDKRITTFIWIIRVHKSTIAEGHFVSSDYYNVLTRQIATLLANSKPPYINLITGHWMVWKAELGQYVDSGISAQGLSYGVALTAIDRYSTANDVHATVKVLGGRVINIKITTYSSTNGDAIANGPSDPTDPGADPDPMPTPGPTTPHYGGDDDDEEEEEETQTSVQIIIGDIVTTVEYTADNTIVSNLPRPICLTEYMRDAENYWLYIDESGNLKAGETIPIGSSIHASFSYICRDTIIDDEHLLSDYTIGTIPTSSIPQLVEDEWAASESYSSIPISVPN